jgi:outer membrane receptor for ferrienterochelin and colicin
VSTLGRVQAFTKNGWAFEDGSSLGTQLSGTYTMNNAVYGLKSYDATEGNGYANFIYEKNWDGCTEEDYLGELTVGAEANDHSHQEIIHKLSAGLSYQFNWLQENYKDRQLMAEDLNGNMLKPEHIPGVFAQYSFNYGEKVSLVAGMRYDYNSYYNQHLYTPRLHLRYSPMKSITIRVSGGKGYRSPNLFAENIGLMASSRLLVVEGKIAMEEAWNYGLNYTQNIVLNSSNTLTLSLDYYRTDFVNQLIINQDRNFRNVFYYMSKDKSFSNSIQAEAKFSLFDAHWDLTLAGRYNDVRQNLDGNLIEKPYTSRWKALIVNNVRTNRSSWMFDLTTQFNGGVRLPNTNNTRPEYSKPYWIMHVQITKRFKYVDIYLGCENILNQIQHDPIISPENPFSDNFDATIVYGSLMNRVFYLGVRLTI